MEEFKSTAEGFNPSNPFEDDNHNSNNDQDVVFTKQSSYDDTGTETLLLTAPPPAMPAAPPPPSPTKEGNRMAKDDFDDASNAHTPPRKLPLFSPPPPPPVVVGMSPPNLSVPSLTIPTNTPMGYIDPNVKLPLHPTVHDSETVLLLESGTASPMEPPTDATANGQSKKKKKKKSKKKKKPKSYSQQYNAQPTLVELPPDDGVDPPSLINFCKPKKPKIVPQQPATTINGHPAPISTYTSKTIDGNVIHINTNTGSLLQGGPNTGLLNSSNGEGTTLPELLLKMRLLNLLHIFATWFVLGFNVVSKVIFLEADKIVLAGYLLFFTILLFGFEVLRGSPKVDTKLVSAQTSAIVKTVWGTALQNPLSRRMRYFLQSNFGLLYSCSGRGVYLAIMGSIAIGQGWPMVCLGVSYILLGIWTVSLGWRYPLLEEALVMEELEREFGEVVETSNSWRGEVTWSSIHSSGGRGTYPGSMMGEAQNLLGSVR